MKNLVIIVLIMLVSNEVVHCLQEKENLRRILGENNGNGNGGNKGSGNGNNNGKN